MRRKKVLTAVCRTVKGILKQGVIFLTAGTGFLKLMNVIFNDWSGVVIVLLINLTVQILKKYNILKTPFIKIGFAIGLGVVYTICYKSIATAIAGTGFSGFWRSSSLWTVALLTGPCSVFMYELVEKVLHQKIVSNKMAWEIYNDVYLITKNKTVANIIACVFLGWTEYRGKDEVEKVIGGLVQDDDFSVITEHIDKITQKYLKNNETKQ